MGTWYWFQPGEKMWKVVSDYKTGTIHIYDENGKKVMEKSNLDKEAIKIIEKNFLDVIANNENKKGTQINGYSKNNIYS